MGSQRPIGPHTQAERGPKRFDETRWIADETLRHGKQQSTYPDIQDKVCPITLAQVILVDQFGIPAADREAVDHPSSSFEFQDFTADEGVADLGVLADEIGDLKLRPSELVSPVSLEAIDRSSVQLD